MLLGATVEVAHVDAIGVAGPPHAARMVLRIVAPAISQANLGLAFIDGLLLEKSRLVSGTANKKTFVISGMGTQIVILGLHSPWSPPSVAGKLLSSSKLPPSSSVT